MITSPLNQTFQDMIRPRLRDQSLSDPRPDKPGECIDLTDEYDNL